MLPSPTQRCAGCGVSLEKLIKTERAAPGILRGADLVTDLEYRAEAVPPKADGLMADIDTALGQQILDMVQGEQTMCVHQYRKAPSFSIWAPTWTFLMLGRW